MAAKQFLVFLAFISLVFANDIEDGEQKKRATSKGPTSLNAIPTGGQKPEYTYLYQQQPGVQTQAQVQPATSFYPHLPATNQLYNQAEHPVYQQQGQVNYITPQNTQQFVPLNFIPTPGYQSKYQILSGKSGNVQLAILPQSGYLTPPPVFQPQYSQQVQNVPVHGQSYQAQQYQVPQGYVNQPYLSQPYLGQSSMVLYAQPGAQLYNNLYSNAAQQLYSYFQSNPQAKYQLLYGSQQGENQYYGNQAQQPQQQQQVEYNKPLPGPITQSISKEGSDLNSNEYVTPAESNSSYNNAYSASRGSSYKAR